jgi:hypothetical protein
MELSMKITHDILTNTVAKQFKKTVPVNEGITSDNTTSEKFNQQQKQSFAADIYHKDEHTPKNQSTYDRPLSITAHKSESELLDKMTNTISFGELPKKLSQLRPKYENFLNELEVSSPSLAQKNWGFSINSDDKLVVFGDITEDEKSYLEGKLNADKDIVSLVKELPNILMKGQEYDRGYDGKGKYWGKYDVTQDNFKDIIDVKALLDSSYGPNAKAFDDGFDIFSYQDNLRSQLASKAEIKYAY